MNTKPNKQSIIMLGASGAVGTQALNELIQTQNIQQLTLLGRKAIENITADFVQQHNISIFDASTYEELLAGHTSAICTLGVGEPSKISKEQFVKIDKTAVLDFATACKKAGVKHFELLVSVGTNPNSSSFFLKTKGELIEALKDLNFERLSIFQPSMILTPTNRYGFTQGILQKTWPFLKPILFGSLKQYRGVPVEDLGKVIARNIFNKGKGFEQLQWEDFYSIIK